MAQSDLGLHCSHIPKDICSWHGPFLRHTSSAGQKKKTKQKKKKKKNNKKKKKKKKKKNKQKNTPTYTMILNTQHIR